MSRMVVSKELARRLELMGIAGPFVGNVDEDGNVSVSGRFQRMALGTIQAAPKPSPRNPTKPEVRDE